MGSEWKECCLSDFIGIKHGFAFKGEFFKPEETFDYLLTPGNFLIGGGFKADKFKYYDGPVPQDYVLQKDDLVVTMTDLSKEADTLGYSALVPEIRGHRLLHNQRVGLVQFNNDELDKTYLYFLLRSRGYRNHVMGSVTGTTVKHTSPTKILSYKFRKPPKDVQIKIGKNLLTIEKKIQLNRETNQTLETMAQALFKSWFVDFDPVFDNAIAHNLANNKDPLHNIPESLLPHAERRLNVHNEGQNSAQTFHHLFPQTFEQSDEPSVGIQGWVPQGWGSGNLLKSVDLVGGGTPKTKVEEYWNGDIPWFSVVDAPNDSDIFVIDTDKKVTQLGVDNSSTKILRKGTTIISARGTVGKCALVGVPMAMNQSCYGVQGLKGFTDEYVYYLVRFRVSDLQQRGHGSVFNTITKDTFESITSAIPAESVMASFSKILKPSFDKVLKNIEQSKELESLRDTLLPKLISGELRIPDAQQPTEALHKRLNSGK